MISILQDPPKKRFKPTTSKDMDELFEARQAPNTKRNTLWGLKIFQGTYILTICGTLGAVSKYSVVDIDINIKANETRFCCIFSSNNQNLVHMLYICHLHCRMEPGN